MKRAKRIGWNNVSLIVDVTVCSHFAHFIARMLVLIKALTFTVMMKRSCPRPMGRASIGWGGEGRDFKEGGGRGRLAVVVVVEWELELLWGWCLSAT